MWCKIQSLCLPNSPIPTSVLIVGRSSSFCGNVCSFDIILVVILSVNMKKYVLIKSISEKPRTVELFLLTVFQIDREFLRYLSKGVIIAEAS